MSLLLNVLAVLQLMAVHTASYANKHLSKYGRCCLIHVNADPRSGDSPLSDFKGTLGGIP